MEVDRQEQESQRNRRVRKEAAPSIQAMVQKGFLNDGQTILCYGCGRGVDVNWLRMRRLHAQGYDPYEPYGFAEAPKGAFDVVILAYVMKRLQTHENRRETLRKAAGHVRPGGHLVIITRNWSQFVTQEEPPQIGSAVAYFQGLIGTPDFGALAAHVWDEHDSALCLQVQRGGIYEPQHPVVWIDEPGEFAALCTRLAREPMVALDVETTLEEPRVLCTIQLGIPGRTWVVDALAMSDLRPVKDLLENERVEKVIHNAFFEEQMFAKHQIRIVNIFDTLPASRKKYQKQSVTGGHKLGDVCERELGIYLDKTNQTSDWTLRPLRADQLAYAAIDAEVLVELYRIFKPPVQPTNLELFALE
ncbi:MAG: methyltransferase domain-containing protein [Candidatus Hydrogenedentes bacterium]|nr:methyltransferase domain-containing protein [Candidatus Hydrogenedentota bacterium]